MIPRYFVLSYKRVLRVIGGRYVRYVVNVRVLDGFLKTAEYLLEVYASFEQ